MALKKVEKEVSLSEPNKPEKSAQELSAEQAVIAEQLERAAKEDQAAADQKAADEQKEAAVAAEAAAAAEEKAADDAAEAQASEEAEAAVAEEAAVKKPVLRTEVKVLNLRQTDFRQHSSGRWIKAGQEEYLLNDGWLRNHVRAKLLKIVEE